MTDCIHCGQNPGEVCRGCYERARQPEPLPIAPTSDLHRCAMFAEILPFSAVEEFWRWHKELPRSEVRLLCESHERLRLELQRARPTLAK